MASFLPVSLLPSALQQDSSLLTYRKNPLPPLPPQPSPTGSALRRRSSLVSGYFKRQGRRFFNLSNSSDRTVDSASDCTSPRLLRSPGVSEEHQNTPAPSWEPGSRQKGRKPTISCRTFDATVYLDDPYVLLSGFDSELNDLLSLLDDTDGSLISPLNPPVFLRGKVHLRVRHQTRLRSLSLRFFGSSCVQLMCLRQMTPTAAATSHGPEVRTIIDHRFPAFISRPSGDTRTIEPGDYVFSFSVQVPNNIPESSYTDLGRVHYQLELSADVVKVVSYSDRRLVKRMSGTQLVNLVRAPSPHSDSGNLIPDPISISRNWNNTVQYDLLVHGRVFVFGSVLPIELTFAPLNKLVYCHTIRVEILERTRYTVGGNTSEKEKVTKLLTIRSGPSHNRSEQRRVIMSSLFPGTTVSVCGMGLTTFEDATRAHIRHGGSQPSEHVLGRTRCDLSIQLPPCRWAQAANSKRGISMRSNMGLHHDTTSPNVEVRHFLRVVLRVSFPRLNSDPGTGFMKVVDVTTESPIQLLSCLADPIQWALPPYEASDANEPETVVSAPTSPCAPAGGDDEWPGVVLNRDASIPACACHSSRARKTPQRGRLLLAGSPSTPVTGSVPVHHQEDLDTLPGLPAYEHPPDYESVVPA